MTMTLRRRMQGWVAACFGVFALQVGGRLLFGPDHVLDAVLTACAYACMMRFWYLLGVRDGGRSPE